MSRLCFLVVTVFVISFVAAQDYELNLSFLRSGIIPDVLSVGPVNRMTVQYNDSALFDAGDVLTPTEVKDVPMVTWPKRPNRPNTFYTVVMIDPDAPSREEPTYREWLHWLVVNVHSNNIAGGDTIAEYVGAGPGRDTGLHRYVFLVYEQPYWVVFREPRLTNRSMANRTRFSIRKFAKKYELGDLIAGTFFEAEYDDYVPILYRKLGAATASGGVRSTQNSYVIALTGLVTSLALLK